MMELPDQQLKRGLTRAVLKHGWIPRLMNLSRRLSIPKCFGKPSRLDILLGSAHSLCGRNGITRQILAAEASVRRLQDEEEPPFNPPIREQHARGVVSAAEVRRVDLERYLPETTSSPNMAVMHEIVQTPPQPPSETLNNVASTSGSEVATMAAASTHIESDLNERADSSSQTISPKFDTIGTQCQPKVCNVQMQATSIMCTTATQCTSELKDNGTQIVAENAIAYTQTEVAMLDSSAQVSPLSSTQSSQTETVYVSNVVTQSLNMRTQSTQTQVDDVKTERGTFVCQAKEIKDKTDIQKDIVEMVRLYMDRDGHHAITGDQLLESRVADMLNGIQKHLALKKRDLKKEVPDVAETCDHRWSGRIRKSDQAVTPIHQVENVEAMSGKTNKHLDQDVESDLQGARRDVSDGFPNHRYVYTCDELNDAMRDIKNDEACDTSSRLPADHRDGRDGEERVTWEVDWRQIPLPTITRPSKSQSVPGWFPKPQDPSFLRQFLREVRNGTVSLYRLPSRDYNFEVDNDWLLRSYDVQRNSWVSVLSSSSHNRGWVNPFLETFPRESELICCQKATAEKGRLRSPQPVPVGDLRRYLRGSLLEMPDSSDDDDEVKPHLGSTVKDEDSKAPVLFVNDTSDISGNVRSRKSERSFITITSSNCGQWLCDYSNGRPAAVTSVRNVSPRTRVEDQYVQAVPGTSNAATTDVVKVPGEPKLYVDRHGYYVPDVNVPTVAETDLTWEFQSDGNRRFLGAGSFGYVQAARLTRPDGLEVAVAVKRCHHFYDLADLIREGQLYEYIKDLQVVPIFYGYLSTTEGNVGLVSELFSRGRTLADQLQHSRPKLIPKDWVKICLQLTEGLRKIHSKEIIYNDIKSNNVLVDTSWRGNPVVKYIDLGLATVRRGMTYSHTPAQLRSIRHIAPEVKRGQPTSVESDIWGLGVIFWDIAEHSDIGGIKDIAKASLMTNRRERITLNDIMLGLARVMESLW